jgi:hypothetical protein
VESLFASARVAGLQGTAWLNAAAADPFYAKLGFAGAFLLALGLIATLWFRRRERPRGHYMAQTGERALVPIGAPDDDEVEVTRIGTIANKIFLQFETIAYIVLGLLLAVTIVLGITGTGTAVFKAAFGPNNETILVFTVDRMLFVLMVVEILRTVRDSFRSGTLVSEPFLIVGLIASIRRVLVITLESSQVNRQGGWTPASQSLFNSSMLELAVLGALILIMVVSIFLLRYSRRFPRRR